MRRTAILATLILSSAFVTQAQAPNAIAKPEAGETKPSISPKAVGIPLFFEANQGQTDSRVKFLTRGNGYTLFMTPTETVLAESGTRVIGNKEGFGAAPEFKSVPAGALRMQLIGANRAPAMRGSEELPGKLNYLMGNDPAQWHTGVPLFSRVQTNQVYPGVDLVFHGNERALEYDFVVAPGADPNQVAFRIRGAKRIEIDSRGDLVLHTAASEFRMHKPVIYQADGASRKPIDGGFILSAKNEVRFQLGAYDRTQELVIDPAIGFSSFLGGAGFDIGNGFVVDDSTPGSPKLYVSGETSDSASFTEPKTIIGSGTSTTAPIVTEVGFVAKIDPTVTGAASLIYLTFIGGKTPFQAADGSCFSGVIWLALDKTQGAANVQPVLGAQTTCSDYPTTTTINPVTAPSQSDIAVVATRLTTSGGAVDKSAMIGGNGQVSGSFVSVGIGGEVLIAGATSATNLPVKNAYVSTINNGNAGFADCFVAKLERSDLAATYLTYTNTGGGSTQRKSSGCGAFDDASGNILAGGNTVSATAFNLGPGGASLANGFEPTFPANATEATWAMKLNPNLSGTSQLLFATYFAGGGKTAATNGAFDLGNGIVAIVGRTNSNTAIGDIPLKNAFQTQNKGAGTTNGQTGYLVVGDTTKTGAASLVCSTYFGGSSGNDIIGGVGYDAGDPTNFRILLSGQAVSTDFPVMNEIQPYVGASGSPDGFVSVLSVPLPGQAFAASLVFSTFIGGSNPPAQINTVPPTILEDDRITGVGVDSSHTIYAVGSTNSPQGFFANTNPATAVNGFQTSCASCGGATALDDVVIFSIKTGGSATLNSIAVTPTSASIPAGQTQQFHAVGNYSDGTEQDLTNTVAWSTVPGGIATMSTVTPGLAMGVAPGVTAVTPTLGSTPVLNTGSLTVTGGAVATHFSVAAPSTATAGTAINITVTALDASNHTVTGYAGTVHFTSTDGAATLPANATLTSGAGNFQATLKTIGPQTITATDTVSASITGTSGSITVSAGAATHFLVSAPATATAGTPINFTVTAKDAANNTVTTYAGTVNFSSSDAAATLPSSDVGLTNGVGNFQATLRTAGPQTMTATDTVTTSITGSSGTITVSAAALVSIAVTPANPSIAKGRKQQFTATGTFSDNSMQNITNSVTWASATTSVATISNTVGSQGLATSIGTGTSTISATMSGINGSTVLTVGPAVLASLNVTPKNQQIVVGSTLQFTATGTLTDGTIQDFTKTVTWSSLKPTVATISNTDPTQGLATAVSTVNSPTVITATQGNISDLTQLGVIAAPTFVLTITEAGSGAGTVISSPAGINCPAQCTASYASGTPVTLIATPATGSSFAGWSGACTNTTGTCAVTMTQAQNVTATFTGAVLQFTLTVTDAGTGAGTVTSQAGLAPTISCTTGSATGCSGSYNSGTAVTLAAASATGSTFAGWSAPCAGSTTATCSFTMPASAQNVTATFSLSTGPTLVSIDISPTNPTVGPGQVLQLTAQGNFSDGSTQNLTTSTTWATSSQTVATISNAAGTQGQLTGVAGGTATITATSAGVTGQAFTTVSSTPFMAPSQLFFTEATLGMKSPSQTTTFTNPGPGAVQVSGVSATGRFPNDFSHNADCGTVAGPGTCPISTAFTPSTAGPETADLLVASNSAASPTVAHLTGNGSIRQLAGFTSNVLPPNDDSSTGSVTLPFTINFFGTNFSSLFVNNNGNVTFGQPLSTFTPSGLNSNNGGIPIIAPYWADVDTSGVGSNVVTYGNDTVNGHAAFGVDYQNVGYFSSHADLLNSFQVILIDRSDTGAGNFDIEFNFDKVQWEAGDASGGTGGLCGALPLTQCTPAAVGYSNGSGNSGTNFQLTGSFVAGALLDGGPAATSLIANDLNNSTLGRYLFSVRNGTVQTNKLTLTLAGTGTGTVKDNTGQLTCSDTGGGQRMCTANYPTGTQLVLTATADTGSTFTGWDAPPPCSGTGTCSFTITQDTNITATFTSGNVTLQSITVAPAAASIGVGAAQTFTATGHFSDGSTGPVAVTWSSGNTAIATINANTGVATGVTAGGPITITASSTQTVGIMGTAQLTVTPPQPTLVSIAVTPANATVVVGQSQQFTATGTFSDGTKQDLTASVVWASSNTESATITAGGLATGLTGGTNTTISATKAQGNANIVGSTMLTVTTVPFVLTITPPAGGTQGTPFTVSPGGSLAVGLVLSAASGFSGTVTFTCVSNAPQFLTCAPAPNSVTLSGNTPKQVAIVMNTFCQGETPIYGPGPGGFGGGLALLLAAVMLGSIAWAYRTRPQWALSFALLMLIALGGAACSSPASGPAGRTPAGNYTLNITATAGGSSQTVQVPVQVTN